MYGSLLSHFSFMLFYESIISNVSVWRWLIVWSEFCLDVDKSITSCLEVHFFVSQPWKQTRVYPEIVKAVNNVIKDGRKEGLHSSFAWRCTISTPRSVPGPCDPSCYVTVFKCRYASLMGRPMEQISTATSRLTIKAAQDLEKLNAQEAHNNGRPFGPSRSGFLNNNIIKGIASSF